MMDGLHERTELSEGRDFGLLGGSRLISLSLGSVYGSRAFSTSICICDFMV